MGPIVNAYKTLSEVKARDHWGDLVTEGKVILKLILEKNV
jgi:hypothetical protein